MRKYRALVPVLPHSFLGTQLKAADFSFFNVADALEVIKADIVKEIMRTTRGYSAEDLVFNFSEDFPRSFTHGALLIAECLADYYRTGQLVVYEYTRESREPVEHCIKLFAVTEDDVVRLLLYLQG